MAVKCAISFFLSLSLSFSLSWSTLLDQLFFSLDPPFLSKAQPYERYAACFLAFATLNSQIANSPLLSLAPRRPLASTPQPTKGGHSPSSYSHRHSSPYFLSLPGSSCGTACFSPTPQLDLLAAVILRRPESTSSKKKTLGDPAVECFSPIVVTDAGDHMSVVSSRISSTGIPRKKR